MNLEFFGRFLKTAETEFRENPYSGRLVFPCGLTDRWTGGYDETNSHFSLFCERV